jgi:hypothetical protein
MDSATVVAPAWAVELKASIDALTKAVKTLADNLSKLSATVASNHVTIAARLDALDERDPTRRVLAAAVADGDALERAPPSRGRCSGRAAG